MRSDFASASGGAGRRLLPNAMRLVVALVLALSMRPGPSRAQVTDPLFPDANGPVYAQALSGDTLYIGGSFSAVGGIRTGGSAQIDAITGLAASSWPRVDGVVYCSAPDGAGGWFVGGRFASVSGVPRGNLAHIRSDGSVGLWDPSATRTDDPANQSTYVLSMARLGTTVYVGGSFNRMGTLTRNGIASIDATTGMALPWAPSVNSSVYALNATPSTIHIGGYFTQVSGQSRLHLAAIDAVSGAVLPWNPGADGGVLCFAIDGSTLYAGGAFQNVGGLARSRLAALELESGVVLPWAPSFDSNVHDVVVSGETIFTCGDFSSVDGQPRGRLAAVHKTNGTVLPWAPLADRQVSALAVVGTTVHAGGTFSTVDGVKRDHLAAMDSGSGVLLPWNPRATGFVRTLITSGSAILAGGSFTAIGGISRENLAAIHVTSREVLSWNPGTDGIVLALGVRGSSVFVGGSFATVAGQPRIGVAAVDREAGAVVAWDPGIEGFVSAIALRDTTVYLGGSFSTISEPYRDDVAAVGASSGTVLPWEPAAQWIVGAFAVSDSTIYLGGPFTIVGGLARSHVAAVDATTGGVLSWDPGADTDVISMAAVGQTLFVGGSFGIVAGQARSHFAAIDATSGALLGPNLSVGGDVTAVATNGTSVYFGGYFFSVGGASRVGLAAVDAASGALLSWNPAVSNVLTVNDDPVLTLVAAGSQVFVGGAGIAVGGPVPRRLARIVDSAEYPGLSGTAVHPGEYVAIGTNVVLQWAAAGGVLGVQSVDLSISRTGPAGPWQPIAAGLAPSGGFEWTVAGPLASGTAYLRSVSRDFAGNTHSALAGPFSITALAVPADAALDPTFPETDGPVLAQALIGDTLFIGGEFTMVGEHATGGSMPINTFTGEVGKSWPRVNGTVFCSARDGLGGWYIGGTFTSVAGLTRGGLAHIRADGSLDSWAPAVTYQLGGGVFTLLLNGSTLYVGGRFETVGGQNRGSLAAVDVNSGAVLPWSPTVSGYAYALAMRNSTLYVGGQFSSVSFTSRRNLAALDAVSGELRTWNPVVSSASDTLFGTCPGGSYVRAMVLIGSTLYIGGGFDTISGTTRINLASIDVESGAVSPWSPAPPGRGVGAMVRSGTTLIVGTRTGSAGSGRRTCFVRALELSTGAELWSQVAGIASSDECGGTGIAALSAAGSTLFVGGEFTDIGGVARTNLAALNVAGGSVRPVETATNGIVRSLTFDGNDHVLAGGSFSCSGKPHAAFAAIDVSRKSVVPWPSTVARSDGTPMVFALATKGSTLYVGGVFTSVGGVPRSSLAAFDAGNGTLLPWGPNANGSVNALLVQGNTVYTGGSFADVSGVTRSGLAAIDGESGEVLPWDPAATGFVGALAGNGVTIFAGGQFSSVGGLSRSNLAAIDAVSGAVLTWDSGTNLRVRSLALVDTTLFVGGQFTSVGGQPRSKLAAVGAASGIVLPWDPNVTGFSVYALAADGPSVMAGGGFFAMGGQPRLGLAAIDATSGALLPWDPGALVAPTGEAVIRTIVRHGSTTYAGGGEFFTNTPHVLGRIVDASGYPSLVAAVEAPNGQYPALIQSTFRLAWSAQGGVFGVQYSDLYLSRNGLGGPWELLAGGVAGPTNFDWAVTGPATTTAYLRVDVRDGLGALVSDVSDAPFAIVSSALDAGPSTEARSLDLAPPSPNPVFGVASIAYSLPAPTRVLLHLHDIQGREVYRVEEGLQQAGRHTVRMDLGRLSAGIYVIRMQALGRDLKRKLVLVR